MFIMHHMSGICIYRLLINTRAVLIGLSEMSRYDVIPERGRDACETERSRRRDSRMMKRSAAERVPVNMNSFLDSR